MKKFYFLIIFFFLFFLSITVKCQELLPFDAQFVIEGEEMSNPYFGGFDNIQISNIDFNRDGIMDLFIFDRQGGIVIPFLRNTNDDQWVYSPEYREIFPKELLHWVYILDYNKDGIGDIFTSKYVAGSGVRVFTGSFNGEWSFEILNFDIGSGSLPKDHIYFQNFSGQYRNLEVATADLPSFTDVDFDGDIDILAFQESGNNIYYYRNTSIERGYNSDSLIFQLDQQCWGGVSESFLGSTLFLSDSPGDCGEGLVNEKDTILELAAGHSTSTLAAYDIDNDRDIDIFVGDADLDSVTFLENNPSNDIDWFTRQTKSFPENSEDIYLESFAIPFFVDINNDQLNDMIIANNQRLNSKNISPIQSYSQDSDGDFSRIEDNWISEIKMDVGSNSSPVLEDVNQDGLLDLIVGNYSNFSEGNSKSSLYYFENIGVENEPKFELINENWIDFADLSRPYFNLKPCFSDIDNDGDRDLLIGTNDGTLIFIKNLAGEGMPYDFDTPIEDYQGIRVSLNAAPQIIDLNGDNLKDLVIGNELGLLNYFSNLGTESSPFFESDVNHSSNIVKLGNVKVTDTPEQFSGRANPCFIQTDNDLLCLIGNINGKIRTYRNINIDGSDWELISSELDDVFEGNNVALAIGNIDNQGFLEYVIGNQRGGLALFKSSLLSNNFDLITSSDIKVDLYPNPFDDHLSIRIGNIGLNANMRFDLYNVLGLKLLSKSIRKDEVLTTKQLSKGLYFWTLKSKELQLKSGKLIKAQ